MQIHKLCIVAVFCPAHAVPRCGESVEFAYSWHDWQCIHGFIDWNWLALVANHLYYCVCSYMMSSYSGAAGECGIGESVSVDRFRHCTILVWLAQIIYQVLFDRTERDTITNKTHLSDQLIRINESDDNVVMNLSFVSVIELCHHCLNIWEIYGGIFMYNHRFQAVFNIGSL